MLGRSGLIDGLLVASIDILKDGGSELYGADAVAGVINTKMRHDLNDMNITVEDGISDLGDGQISGHKGWNFDHGKGNVTFFSSYIDVERYYAV